VRYTDGAVSALVLNTSSKAVLVKGDGPANVYELTARELQAKEVFLNGQSLRLTESDELPQLTPLKSSSMVKLKPYSITFLIYTSAANPACHV
jgi:hypothetical protein